MKSYLSTLVILSFNSNDIFFSWLYLCVIYMYIYICVCIYICIDIHIHTYIYLYMYSIYIILYRSCMKAFQFIFLVFFFHLLEVCAVGHCPSFNRSVSCPLPLQMCKILKEKIPFFL